MRINTSRQSISAKQRNVNYRPDGAIASHVTDATIAYPEGNGRQVIACRQREIDLVGQVVILPGEAFTLVASKFENRYYVVVERDGQFQCSSRDAAVARRCITQVKMHRSQEAA